MYGERRWSGIGKSNTKTVLHIKASLWERLQKSPKGLEDIRREWRRMMIKRGRSSAGSHELDGRTEEKAYRVGHDSNTPSEMSIAVQDPSVVSKPIEAANSRRLLSRVYDRSISLHVSEDDEFCSESRTVHERLAPYVDRDKGMAAWQNSLTGLPQRHWQTPDHAPRIATPKPTSSPWTLSRVCILQTHVGRTAMYVWQAKIEIAR